jgi:hypothetical protein
VILISEEELATLRRQAAEPDARLGDLLEAHKEAERYAAKMENALDHIRLVCRLAVACEPSDVGEVLSLIVCLARVKDDRTTIGMRHLINAQKQG